MIYTIALQINASRLERGHEEQKNVTKKTHFIHVLDNSPDVGSQNFTSLKKQMLAKRILGFGCPWKLLRQQNIKRQN